tara:strand:- start:1962 stop:2123 length:162 start_codon:yes stop_codon:yes gene_type:complete
MKYILKVNNNELIYSDDEFEIKDNYNILKDKGYNPVVIHQTTTVSKKELTLNE